MVAAGREPWARTSSASFSTSSTRWPSTQRRSRANVDQQRDGEVVPLRAHRQVDAVGARRAGAQVAARADQRIEVEVVPVRLGAHQFVARPQRLEPPPHLTDVAADGFVRRPVLAVSDAAAASTRQ